MALKRFYLAESFASCPDFHDYRYNYVVFVNDALYYHDLKVVVHQNETIGRTASRGDFDFLIDESIFLCQKLKIYVSGYQESAYMRSLADYVNNLAISIVEGEIIHIDARDNLQVRTNRGQFNLPYYEQTASHPISSCSSWVGG